MPDHIHNTDEEDLRQQIHLLKAKVTLLYALLIMGSLLTWGMWPPIIIVVLAIVTEIIAKRTR